MMLTVLVGAAAIQRGENLLVWVFASLLAWIIVSGMISGAMMMSLAARRMAPAHGRVGTPLSIIYEVSCTSRWWAIFDVRVGETGAAQCDQGRVVHCGPGDTAVVTGVVHPLKRGVMALSGVRCSSTFPFGLALKSVEFAMPSSVLIHPRIDELPSDLLVRIMGSSSIGATSRSPAVGKGDEVYGLRGFRTGDSIRAIAWKRSSISEELLVIERSGAHARRLHLVLELRNSEEEGRDAQEDAIACAASILHHAQTGGWAISLDIVGYASQEMHNRPVVNRLSDCLDRLASIDLAAPRAGAPTGPRHRDSAMVTLIASERSRAVIRSGGRVVTAGAVRAMHRGKPK